MEVCKVDGERIPPDLVAKAMGRQVMDMLMRKMSVRTEEGSAAVAPELAEYTGSEQVPGGEGGDSVEQFLSAIGLRPGNGVHPGYGSGADGGAGSGHGRAYATRGCSRTPPSPMPYGSLGNRGSKPGVCLLVLECRDYLSGKNVRRVKGRMFLS